MRGVLANGNVLSSWRASRGLTQEQLAAMADCDVKTVRKAEHGQRIDLRTARQIASALGADLSDCVFAESAPPGRAHRLRRCIEKWHDAWNRDDLGLILAQYHDDAVLYLPGAPEIPVSGTFAGRDQIRQVHEVAWKAMRSLPIAPCDYRIFVIDDLAVLEGVKGIPLKHGEVIRLWCLQTFRFRGDRIIEHRVEYDTLRLKALITLAPPRPKPQACRSSR